MTGSCVACGLPAHPLIAPLDDSGVCRQCREYRPIEYLGRDRLQSLLDTSRNPGGKYDCIVNISGGRDSAYTLLAMVRDYGMRALAVNYANPFTHEQAKRNITNMVRALGVDLVQFSFPGRLHERILAHNIRTWFRRPDPAMVPVICIGCKIIWPEIVKIARRNGVRCIVNGGNPYEYTSFKKLLLGVPAGAGLAETYLGNLRGLLAGALGNLAYLDPRYLATTAKAYLFSNQYAIGSRLTGQRLRAIDLFHYVPWDENTVLSRIRRELGWDHPHGSGSSWRFDCAIGHLKDYMYMMTLGLTEKNDFYAKAVREGMMTLRQALARLREENAIDYASIRGVLSTAGSDDIPIATL